MVDAQQTAREQIAWLHRRFGVGLAPGELDAAASRGMQAEVSRLLDPTGAGVPADPDPWAGTSYATDPRQVDRADPSVRANRRQEILDAVDRWIESMVHAQQPLVARMTWFWHGHFATSAQKVPAAGLMVGQLRTLRAGGLGSFPALLRQVTTDPAMLIWLDGRTSTAKEPNENYAREMLELFSLGLGSYGEADVQAGAKALSGWVVLGDGSVRLAPRRHDDAPQTYLGQPGVHDADTVIAAVAANPAMPRFLAGRLGTTMLDPALDDQVQSTAAADFAAAGFEVGALLRSLVTQGAADVSRWGAVVLDPVSWWVQARRATGASAAGPRVVALLRAAGQYPMLPPNVGGWPGGTAWLATSTVSARFELAGLLASQTAPDTPPRAAAIARDWGALADALGRPDGFGSPTVQGLTQAATTGGQPGVAALTLALASPEVTLA